MDGMSERKGAVFLPKAGPPKAEGRARGVGKRDDDGAAKPFGMSNIPPPPN